MNESSSPPDSLIFAERLNEILSDCGLPGLAEALAARFGLYVSLLLKWNASMNLTAIRDPEGILRRHIVESVPCARALPSSVHDLLDFGSGAGIPGIPIALCRSELSVTLAESQAKKAGFLQEAIRVTGIRAQVHNGRAEAIGRQFDCVTMRAVDNMKRSVQSAGTLVKPSGWLALLTSSAEEEGIKLAAGPAFSWSLAVALPSSAGRILLLGRHMG